MRILIVYNYGPPDDNVSAGHFGGVAKYFAGCGDEVDYWCANRPYRNPKIKFKNKEILFGVNYERVLNIPFKKVFVRKIVNNLIFSLICFKRILQKDFLKNYDVVLVGTDPILFFSFFSSLIRLRNPKIQIHLWSFDLYPEAFFAAEFMKRSSLTGRCFLQIANLGYKQLNSVFSIGRCMSDRLNIYQIKKTDYLYPWAMNEGKKVGNHIECLNYRNEYFSTRRNIILLSGSYGFAHETKIFYEFLKNLKKFPNILFVLSVQGNKVEDLKNYIEENKIPCKISQFVPLEKLDTHLRAADVHLTLLNENWRGIVVPSKFFGSISSKKPVLYLGAPNSEIANIINENNIGWVVENNLVDVMHQLENMTKEEFQEIGERAVEVYNSKYSSDAQLVNLRKVFHEQL